jgi:mannose-1-phosphate guanylyltransferase/mannose-6-phosphate isomerase
MTHAVVLAGGWGERLWPMSTRSCPKQLLRLVAGESLVRATLRRIAPIARPGDAVVLTGAAIREAIAGELPGVPPERIIGEPVGRNTAPAIALAAHLLVAEDPDAVMVVLPADHVVSDDAAFCAAVDLAVRAALTARGLVTLGIRPTRPETEYGYMRLGAESTLRGVHEVEEFTEKPDAATAESFLAGGTHLWNSGMFVWRADRFLDELAARLPDVHRALAAVRPDDARFGVEVRRYYEAVPSVSVDYGVMEKADGVLVVPAGFGWDDVGSWCALERVWGDGPGKDSVVRGDAVLVDAERCIVYSETGVVAVVGVSDVIVAHTAGATLVCPKARARDVRRVVEELKRRGIVEA